MHISKGTTVDATWTKAIAMSPNGSNWETIKNDSIVKIMRTYIPGVKNSPANNGYPYLDLAQIVITLKDGTDIRFDVQKVGNQASWNTGAASIPAGLEKAHADLQTWASA